MNLEATTRTAVDGRTSGTITASIFLALHVMFSAHATAAVPALRVSIASDALYSISSTSLAAAFGTNEAQVASWLQARQIEVENLGSTVSADYKSNSLTFFAQGLTSKYTGENVYWIRQVSGTAMKSNSTTSASVTTGKTFRVVKHVETNLVNMAGLFNDPEADPWLWKTLNPASSISKTLTQSVDLPGIIGGDKIVYQVIGAVAPGSNIMTLNVSNSLNVVTIGTDTVLNTTYTIATASAVNASFVPTGNVIRITATVSSGMQVYVDKFSIFYRRSYVAQSNELVFAADTNDPVTVSGFSTSDIEIFDVTSPARPARITGWTLGGSAGNYSASLHPSTPSSRYVAVSGGFRRTPTSIVADAPSDLRAHTNGTDYIAITVTNFAGYAQQLVNYRSSHGLGCRIVYLQDIYDEFNYGIPDPAAIRAFLGYAHRMWNVSPRYAVLIGSGSIDYRNFNNYGDCIVPPLIAIGTAGAGLQASDQPMSDFDGNGSSEIAVGRLPIMNGADFSNMFAKIQTYETGGNWKTQMVAVADTIPDAAGNFEEDNDYVASNTPLHQVTKNYIRTQTVAAARSALSNSLSRGTGLMTYFGHGNVNQLSFTNILTAADAVLLTNKSTPTLIMTMTCLAGNFGQINADSIGEVLAKSASGGVAVWAAGTKQFDADGRSLASALVSNLFRDGTARIGDAIIVATAHNTNRAYACQAYNLLGDPALAVGNREAGRPGPLYPTNTTSYEEWLNWALAPAVVDQGANLDPAADIDGDGVSNNAECLAGTDPLSADSALIITSTARDNAGKITVKWNSASHRAYDLERCTNLFKGQFVAVGNNLSATPPFNAHTDTVSGITTPFYRIRLK